MADDLHEARRRRIESRLEATDAKPCKSDALERVAVEAIVWGDGEPGAIVVGIDGDRVRLMTAGSILLAPATVPDATDPTMIAEDARRFGEAMIRAADRVIARRRRG